MYEPKRTSLGYGSVEKLNRNLKPDQIISRNWLYRTRVNFHRVTKLSKADLGKSNQDSVVELDILGGFVVDCLLGIGFVNKPRFGQSSLSNFVSLTSSDLGVHTLAEKA